MVQLESGRVCWFPTNVVGGGSDDSSLAARHSAPNVFTRWAPIRHRGETRPWTASYVRMRALGDRDAFPAADLGVIKAMAAAGIERRAIAEVAERWRPWRGYATLHLWASLS